MLIDTAAANARSRQPQVVNSPRYATTYTESQNPLLESFDTHDAPPTYLEATTPGLYYGRFSGDEGATLLSRNEQAYKEDAYTGRSLRQLTRTRWMKWLGAVMLIVFVFAAGVAFTSSPRKDKQASVIPIPQPSAQAAETGTSAAPTPTQPSRPNESDGMIAPDIIAVPWPSQSAAAAATTAETAAAPPSSSSQSKRIFPIRWPARCGKKYNVKTEEYDFGSPSEVNIQEALHQLDGPYKRILGWIHITEAPADQAAGTVQARMSYAVSPSVDVDSIQYTSTPNSLILGDPSVPKGLKGVPAGTACLGVSIVLYMAPGTTVETLNIEATHLGMQIHSGVDFSVTNTTSISLTTGTLDAVSLNSRETRLKTTSGSISGKYALADLLLINTTSGSVNIDVEPRAATDANPSPAVFKASTHSGSMRIDFERKHIPEREYEVYLNTTVGSVGGSFIHGSKTEINSIAGSVSADIIPSKSGTYASTLDTRTHSGQMNITLRAPYRAKGTPMLGLASTHQSVSGGMGLRYPKEWQGNINGTSLSGELHLQGKELELLSKNDEPGKNHVEAKKGNGGSSMLFDTVSGQCDVTIGKL